MFSVVPIIILDTTVRTHAHSHSSDGKTVIPDS